MKLVVGLGLAVMTALGAQASPCTKTNFTSANGDIYLEAETALIQGDDPQSVLDLTEDLWGSDLNCFERETVRRLRAATFVELRDYKSAINLLKPLALDESLPDQQRAETANNLVELYNQLGHPEDAAPYAELRDRLRAD